MSSNPSHRASATISLCMPFEAGARLGPYEIIAPIGAGGMGEIYRARDTRLDRTVAVKVLTGALAADSESRRRFEQEARAIAALNDPHICTVHDVGSHGDLDYLVLEYLEGETLADRLLRAPGRRRSLRCSRRIPSWTTFSDAASRRILNGGGKTSAMSPVSVTDAVVPDHLASGTNVLGSKPQYDVARDGRFLLNAAVESASAPIVVSLNCLISRIVDLLLRNSWTRSTRYSSGRVTPAVPRDCAGSLTGHPPMRSGRPPVPERPDTTRQSCFRPPRHRRRGSVRPDRRS